MPTDRETQTANTILGSRLRMLDRGSPRQKDAMRASGESVAQEISDSLRAHPGRENATGPSTSTDVNHGDVNGR